MTSLLQQINGENLLTVEYDRFLHTETVLNKRSQKILTVIYNSAGLPTYFKPESPLHHGMNITYDKWGDITKWSYGNLVEQREYRLPGLVKSVTMSGGQKFRYFYRSDSRKVRLKKQRLLELNV